MEVIRTSLSQELTGVQVKQLAAMKPPTGVPLLAYMKRACAGAVVFLQNLASNAVARDQMIAVSVSLCEL